MNKEFYVHYKRMNCKTLNVCQEFFRNPDYNPRTLRRIKKDAHTYKELVKECGEPEDPFTKFVKETEHVEEKEEIPVFVEPGQDKTVLIGQNWYDGDELYDYILNLLKLNQPIIDPNDPNHVLTDQELNQIYQMKGIHIYPDGVQLNHVDDTQNLYHYFVTIENPGALSSIIDLGYVPSDISEDDTFSEQDTSDSHAQLVYKLWDSNKILDSNLDRIVLEIGKPRRFWMPGLRSLGKTDTSRRDNFLNLMNSIRMNS